MLDIVTLGESTRGWRHFNGKKKEEKRRSGLIESYYLIISRKESPIWIFYSLYCFYSTHVNVVNIPVFVVDIYCTNNHFDLNATLISFPLRCFKVNPSKNIEKASRTTDSIKKFFIPCLNYFVEKFIASCDICQKFSIVSLKSRSLNSSVPKSIFETIIVGTVSLPRDKDGYRYLSLFRDAFSLFVEGWTLKHLKRD